MKRNRDEVFPNTTNELRSNVRNIVLAGFLNTKACDVPSGTLMYRHDGHEHDLTGIGDLKDFNVLSHGILNPFASIYDNISENDFKKYSVFYKLEIMMPITYYCLPYNGVYANPAFLLDFLVVGMDYIEGKRIYHMEITYGNRSLKINIIKRLDKFNDLSIKFK